jgi:hypothetical protein
LPTFALLPSPHHAPKQQQQQQQQLLCINIIKVVELTVCAANESSMNGKNQLCNSINNPGNATNA